MRTPTRKRKRPAGRGPAGRSGDQGGLAGGPGVGVWGELAKGCGGGFGKGFWGAERGRSAGTQTAW